MPFITIFTAPKPFTDPHIATIQRNAIQSWLLLGSVEVLLVGEEPGLSDIATEYGIHHLPEVARNDLGTPLVSSIFSLARQASTSPMLAYVNADIILTPDFVDASKRVSEQLERFLVVGQRWDLEVRQVMDFSSGWDQRLKSEIENRGQLHAPAGSDFFLFPRTLSIEMPDFAIGRAGWDNWMIYHARQQGWPIVDATPSLMVVHQDHDYGHLPGGKPHYNQAESRQNEAFAGGPANLYMVLDSDKQLIDGKVRAPKPNLLRVLRRAEVWLMPPDGERLGTRWSLARRFRRLRRRISGTL